jgi:hypothetical protein
MPCWSRRRMEFGSMGLMTATQVLEKNNTCKGTGRGGEISLHQGLNQEHR